MWYKLRRPVNLQAALIYTNFRKTKFKGELMGRNIHLVKLYQTNEAMPDHAVPLKIDDKNIAFLKTGLFQQLQLTQAGNEWWLEFFVESKVSQRLVVEFEAIANAEAFHKGEKNPPRKNNHQFVPLLTQMVYVESDEPATDVEACCEASQIIKGSKAIQLSHLHHASMHCSYIDGRGIVYLAKSFGDKRNAANYAQFQRHILLTALAYAYLAAMDELGNQISTVLSDISAAPNNTLQEAELRELYREVIMFNAQCFFQEPVSLQAPALREAWMLLEQKLAVGDINNQLFRQIENVHFIVDLEVSKREKSLHLKLTVFAIFIGIVSALSVIDIIRNWLK